MHCVQMRLHLHCVQIMLHWVHVVLTSCLQQGSKGCTRRCPKQNLHLPMQFHISTTRTRLVLNLDTLDCEI